MGNADLPNGTAQQDAAWLDGALDELTSVAVSAALESRILASFDAVARRRETSLGAAVHRLAARLRDAVWPGAPAWQPAMVLAVSLLIGVVAGSLVPYEDMAMASADQTASIALDAPPDFDPGESS